MKNDHIFNFYNSKKHFDIVVVAVWGPEVCKVVRCLLEPKVWGLSRKAFVSELKAKNNSTDNLVRTMYHRKINVYEKLLSARALYFTVVVVPEHVQSI